MHISCFNYLARKMARACIPTYVVKVTEAQTEEKQMECTLHSAFICPSLPRLIPHLHFRLVVGSFLSSLSLSSDLEDQFLDS